MLLSLFVTLLPVLFLAGLMQGALAFRRRRVDMDGGIISRPSAAGATTTAERRGPGDSGHARGLDRADRGECARPGQGTPRGARRSDSADDVKAHAVRSCVVRESR